jgi:predicted lipid-binding transport protein (Tim44 family)
MAETTTMGVMAGLVQGLAAFLITIIVALGTAAMIWLVVRGLGALRPGEAVATKPTASAAVAPAAVDEAEIARRVAVVAAAVATAAGRTRVVRIGEAPVPGLWRTTGRALHHRSHTPHR